MSSLLVFDRFYILEIQSVMLVFSNPLTFSLVHSPLYVFIQCVTDLAGHRHQHAGIRFLSLVPEHSSTGMGPLIPVLDWLWHRHFCSIRYWTDWMPDSPAFWHKKMYILHVHIASYGLGYTLYVHFASGGKRYTLPACSYCRWWKGTHPSRPYC